MRFAAPAVGAVLVALNLACQAPDLSRFGDWAGQRYPDWPPCGGGGNCVVHDIRPDGERYAIHVAWRSLPRGPDGSICGRARWVGDPPRGPAAIELDPTAGPGTWRHEVLHARIGAFHRNGARRAGPCGD